PGRRCAPPVYDAGLTQTPILRGSTVGFIAFGTIGAETWRVLRCLGLRGIAVTRSGRSTPEHEGLEWSAGPERLEDLLSAADHVVVCLPLSSETGGLIGAPQFARMKISAVLVNVARGAVVDEQALFEALRTHRITGAAIDVWYQYRYDATRGAPSRPALTAVEALVEPT